MPELMIPAQSGTQRRRRNQLLNGATERSMTQAYAASSGGYRAAPVWELRLSAPLLNGVIEALVVERAFERGQILAEIAGRGCRQARIKGSAVAPPLDDGEMIPPTGDPHEHVEPQITRQFAAGLGELPKKGCSPILAGRDGLPLPRHIPTLPNRANSTGVGE